MTDRTALSYRLWVDIINLRMSALVSENFLWLFIVVGGISR